ncbi:MAG: purine-nucleoside phosphorylase [Chloroflexi bacterium]|nr:purine-nucleoside phosphorylase [Chloroflexota bacterium]
MPEFYTKQHFARAAEAIFARTRHRPQVAVVLGSGLGGLVSEVQDADVIPYSEIPEFPQCTVEGHMGRLVIGRLEGTCVAMMQGRAHYYEGYSMQQVTFPVRTFQQMGIGVLIVTNAAGGLNPEFRAGDLMLIADHINLVGMAGLNPLRGPNDPELGPRFPDMSRAYDPELRAIARRVAAREGIPLREGVYIMLAGPSFETPADMRFLRAIGADAVGMSTVPEVTVARHGGTRVLGISGIANTLSPGEAAAGHDDTTHEEVLAAGRVLAPRLAALIRGVLRELGGT